MLPVRPYWFFVPLTMAIASLMLVGCGSGKTADTSGRPVSSSLGKVAYAIDGGIYMRSLPDGEARKVAEGTKPRWSPSGDWLLFERDRISWEVRDDGSGEQQLTEEADNSALSPDGTHRAYVETVQDASRPLGRYDRLHLADADGSNDSVIYEFDGGIVFQGWTADSKYILFWNDIQFSASLMADGTDLEAIPVSGGEPRRLYAGLTGPGMISYAPNEGETLAVVEGSGRDTWTGKRIALVDVGNGNVTPLTSEDMASLAPSWSPDGRRIAFVSQPDSHFSGETGTIPQLSHDRRIWVMNRDGGNQHPLTSDPAYRDEQPLWSADGSQILFVRLDNHMQASLWLMNADGNDLRQIVDAFGPMGANAYYGGSDTLDYYGAVDWGSLSDWWQPPSSQPTPQFSATATPLSPADELAAVPRGSVLFLTAGGYSDNLYLIDANGGQPRQLLDSAESDIPGGFSPDGKLIAYTSQLRDDGQPEGVYVISSDGSNPRPVATEGLGDWFISWSAQGKILYTDGGLAAGDYLVVNSDGSDRVRISQNNYCTEGASWSSDGENLVLCQCDSAPEGSLACTLSIIDLQGDSLRTLLKDDTVIPHSPRWSPDGSRILYTQQKQGGGPDSIVVVNADGTSARSIYESPANGTWTEAKWSPNGSQIAVMTTTQIAVVSVADGSSHALATSKYIGAFAWSPDSRKIAYVAGDGAASKLYVAASEGGEPKLLADRAGPNVSWSPDGKQILFASNLARQDGVWWASPDGSNRGRLAALSGEYQPPAEPTVEGLVGGCEKGSEDFSCLSPNGKSEALALMNSNIIQIKDLASGQTRSLTTPEVSAWNSSPVWSNDATKIALSSPGPPGPLYVVDVATGTARAVAAGLGSGGYEPTVAWSPDDSYIYYVKGTVCREGCAPGFLYRVHPDGTGEERVVNMRIALVYGFKP